MGPLGRTRLLKRAMKRSNPIDGSSVVLLHNESYDENESAHMDPPTRSPCALQDSCTGPRTVGCDERRISCCDRSDTYVVSECTSNTADHDVVASASVGTTCGTEARILH